MRIDAFLTEQKVTHERLVHAPAFTAQKLAKTLHLPGSQVVKCVLLHGPEGFLLALLPATQQADLELLAKGLGGTVRLADDKEMSEVFSDCEWGVAPPFGTLYGLPSVLEDSLHPDALLVFETHTHVDAVRLLCRDFERLEKPRRLRFARTPVACSCTTGVDRHNDGCCPDSDRAVSFRPL